MFTGFTVTIPANTIKSAPYRETFHLSWGFIAYFGFFIYPESVGLTHFYVEHQSRQLFPFDPDEDFSMPGRLMQYTPEMPLKSLPYNLEIVAWNEDDRHPHTIHIFLGLKRRTLTSELTKLLEYG